jgi:hypothetical protein
MTWMVISGCALFVLALVGTCWVFHRTGWDSGYEEGRADVFTELGAHRAAAPRHAYSTPRTEIRAKTGPLPPVGPVGPPPRLVPTADDIAPVIVPEPGTLIPFRTQPAPSPATETGQLPAITSTGELRVLSDAYIAQMRSGEAAWRAKAGL